MALTIKDLCELAQVNTEDEENQYIADLLKDPIDRKTTGDACVKLFGYDPTIVFDQIEMTKILDEFLKEHSLEDVIRHKESIIVNAMETINSDRSAYQITALETAIREELSDCGDGDVANVFEAWAKKHYSAKVMYDPDYDEDDTFDDEDEDTEDVTDTVTVGNDSSEYTSDDDEDDEDDDFDDED